MSLWAYALWFGFLGYLVGSLPFAIWVTRWFTGKDVRSAGSRHATATNTMRQAGWGAGILVFCLDFGKGALPTLLASHYSPVDWVVPLTAALVVVGHCWPVLAEFRGGMGLATAGGAILAVSPLALAIALVLLVLLMLALRHSARAAVIAGLVAPIAIWLFGFQPQVVWVLAAVGWVIAFRFLRDWRRKYRELWLDREKAAGEQGAEKPGAEKPGG